VSETTRKELDLKQVEDYFDGNPNLRKNNLIAILQKIQEFYGYLPEEALEIVAERINVPKAKIYGVCTFYSQFKLEPDGKYLVQVCNGTACHVRGAPALVDEISGILGISEGQTTPDNLFTLETVNCIGACGLAPAVVINEEIYGKVTPDKIHEIISNLKAGEK